MLHLSSPQRARHTKTRPETGDCVYACLPPSEKERRNGEEDGTRSCRRREEVGVVKVLAAVDACGPLTLGRESAVVDAPTGIATVQLAAGLDTLAEGVEDLDGRVPVDAGVAVKIDSAVRRTPGESDQIERIKRGRRSQQASED